MARELEVAEAIDKLKARVRELEAEISHLRAMVAVSDLRRSGSKVVSKIDR